jgi:hypothetical protein
MSPSILCLNARVPSFFNYMDNFIRMSLLKEMTRIEGLSAGDGIHFPEGPLGVCHSRVKGLYGV